MRKYNLAGFSLLLTLLAGPVFPAGGTGKQAGTDLMAQNNAEQEAVPGRDVLVAGAGALVGGQSRTTIKIDLGAGRIPPRPKLEISLAPSEVVAGEPYLIILEGADAKRLGAVSFFPPKAGSVQAFYFDAEAIVTDMKARGTTSAELSLSLVPTQKAGKPLTSKVRVVGARIAGN
jgi:hypothetical protein